MTMDIVIVAAARTAVGKFGGSLAKIPASELGATVLKALLERAKLSGEQISEVILGQVLQAGAGQNPARQAVIKGGLGYGVPAMTINKVCGSGLNDGAAGVVVMSAARADALGLKPLGRIASYASAGLDPAYMGMGLSLIHI